ncbi:MAG: UDP-N-acetylmuramyl-tripeptide synthetase [Patescibacteria group bacterium]
MWQTIKNYYHLIQAIGANIYYGWPSKKLKVIGVTGTDGKTTTTSLIYHILINSGHKASMITTVYAKVGTQEFDTGLHTTTPHSFDVQRFLKKSVEAGDEFFILESTSHALHQYRIYDVDFEIGLITNITHESLEYHKTYENYVKAKLMLLLMSKKILINKDDGSYKLLSEHLHKAKRHFKTYGLNEKTDYKLEISEKIKQKLTEFNRYNYLAAYAVCHELGIPDEKIFEAMKTFKLPVGRFEVVYDKDFTIIVDFAHTPNAMYQLLKSVKQLYPSRRVINMFGSAGFRDVTKRPIMGEASGEFADLTIITEDDPRTEDPMVIAEEIAQGLQKKGFEQVTIADFGESLKKYCILTNREKAIKKAISIAKKGDVLVFNGKGHEKSIARGNREDPWSDQEETIKVIKELGIKNRA